MNQRALLICNHPFKNRPPTLHLLLPFPCFHMVSSESEFMSYTKRKLIQYTASSQDEIAPLVPLDSWRSL